MKQHYYAAKAEMEGISVKISKTSKADIGKKDTLWF